MTSVGVVVPTRDREVLLRRAVESVRAADEIVVIDDASTTYPPHLADELERIGARYLRLPYRQGPCAARNRGVGLARTDLVLFLDDDDFLLDGGIDRIREVADAHPERPLYLHNCRFSSGGATLEQSSEVRELSFDEWLRWTAQAARTELKPVTRRWLFDQESFDDTGASGEALLWARVIRQHGAVVSHAPIVWYDVEADRARLTSTSELIARAPENALIARKWLEEVGPRLRSLDQAAWRRTLVRAALYAALAGQPNPDGDWDEMGWRWRLVARLIRLAPRRLLRIGFGLLRRDGA